MAQDQDGQIVLGLDVAKTTTKLQETLNQILRDLHVRGLMIEASVDRKAVTQAISQTVKQLQAELKDNGVDIKINSRDVAGVLGQQLKIASAQEECNKKMEEYVTLAREVGTVLREDTLTSFQTAMDSKDITKAKEALADAKKQIEEYQRAIQKMNTDTTMAKSIETLVGQFERLRNVPEEVQRQIDGLRSGFQSLNNIGNVQDKLSKYNELKTTIANLQTEYVKLQNQERQYTSDSGIEKRVQNMKSMYELLNKQYGTAQGAGANGVTSALSSWKTALDAFEKVSSSSSGRKLAEEFEKVEKAAQEATVRIKEYRIEQSQLSGVQNQLTQVTRRIQEAMVSVSGSGATGTGVDNLTSSLSALLGRAQELRGVLADIDPSNGADVEALSRKILQLKGEFGQLGPSIKAFSSAINFTAFTESVTAAQKKVADYAKTYSAIKSRPDLVAELKELQDQAKRLFNPTDVKQFNAAFDTFDNKVKDAGVHCQSLTGKFKEAFQSFTTFFSVGRLISETIRMLREMAEQVIELNTAMTELKKVSDETDTTLNNFLERAKGRAVELGTSVVDLVNATADFKRLGYGLNEASELAEVATIYANVGDDVNGIDAATSSLISTMKAFGIEASQAITIVDKLNEIGKMFAETYGNIWGMALIAAISVKSQKWVRPRKDFAE